MKAWPDTKLKYIDQPQYATTAVKKSIQSLSLECYQGFKEGKYRFRDLLVFSYDSKKNQKKLKIKALTNKQHPAYPYFGLFSGKSFVKDELLIKYVGWVTGEEGYDKESDYVLSFLNVYSVDADKMGNEARYINDYRNIASKPNCEFREFFDLNTMELAMGVFTLCDISNNQELLINYGKAFWKKRSLAEEK
ncbi:hypothetical protein K502DRAFT_315898 [Neoconidiobolus thromboides FSU 785]|nr:hypothetical protein K502DRAFT_315898 [Neoconidiobolus thromboides FSU 785]